MCFCFKDSMKIFVLNLSKTTKQTKTNKIRLSTFYKHFLYSIGLFDRFQSAFFASGLLIICIKIVD